MSYFKLGDVRLAQGDVTGAQASFATSLDILEKLTRHDPNNASWQTNAIACLMRISQLFDLAKPEGRDAAREALQKALTIAEHIQQTGSFTSHEQKGWVEDLKRRLAALEQS